MRKTKNTKNTKKKKKIILKTPNIFKDERFKIILGITSSFFTIYIGISILSFFFTGGADQSKLDINWFSLIFDSKIVVNNWTGKTGAYISHILINKWFGIASISFLYILLIFSLKMFSINIKPLRKTLYVTILFCIWTSVLMSFLFVKTTETSYLFLGGEHGYYICKWLNSFVGEIGTFFLLIVSLLAFIILNFSNSIELLKKTFKKKEKLNSKKEEDTIVTKKKTKEKILEPIIHKTAEKIIIQKTIAKEEIVEEEKTRRQDLEDIVLNINKPAKTTGNIKKEAKKTDQEKELALETTMYKEETVSINQNMLEDYDPTLDLSHYEFPSIDLLEDDYNEQTSVSKDELESNKNRIVETLRNYKIDIVQIKATIGPTITLYEIVPAPGIRISKIKNLEDDIALSLSALGIRIIAPIPGRGTVGIEVPNRDPEIVSMASIISSRKFQETKYTLPIALGKTISNETYTLDLTKMPHLLVAGATGQGKSVGLNAIITSLLYKKHPSQLKFVLIDPKKVELSIYATIENHFLAKLPNEEEPIITDINKVIATLNSLCTEMDSRYDLLKKAHTRNIKEYNEKFVKRKLNPENGHRFLPYIVVIIDEFADLIMTAGKEIENPITRIAQLARAIGIHMIIATQRPSTNIITGIIKANFPARIAFKVASMIDSRTILDSPGANQLIGRGDLLVSQGSDLIRVQCAFVDTPEVEAITEHIAKQQSYATAFLLPEYIGESADASSSVDLQKRDGLFEEAARLIVSSQQGSTSSIQRRFSIGYNRAGRIVDQLEAAGVVGPPEGSKARQVLIHDDYALEQLFNSIDR